MTATSESCAYAMELAPSGLSVRDCKARTGSGTSLDSVAFLASHVLMLKLVCDDGPGAGPAIHDKHTLAHWSLGQHLPASCSASIKQHRAQHQQ